MSDHDQLEFDITCKTCGEGMHFSNYEEHLEEEHDHVPELNAVMFNFY